MQSYYRGVTYAVLAGIFLSTGGLIVRLVESADPWLLLFYRSLAFFFTVVVFLLVRNRSNLTQCYRQLRPSDLIVSVSLAGGFIFYVLSLYNTTVANTVLLLSIGPFIAALLAWLVLGEKVGSGTWIAMIIALVGVFVMVSGGLAADDILGSVYAGLAVLSFGIMVVALRSAAQRDMIAATSLAGLIAALFCLTQIDSFQISLRDFLLAISMGSLQVGSGFICLTLASRSVPAAQIPLLALGETALSPLWVWVFVAEVPAAATMTGGGIVLLALIFHGVWSAKVESTA